MYSTIVSNYVFSESLEISVIEYRLIQLFEMLQKIEVTHFFPSLIFNESFWLLPNEKKISVLSFNQLDWVKQNPIHESFFFIDATILEVIRSIKISYFSYSKIDFLSLIQFLRSKNNFAVTEFSAFGDIQNSPIVVLNRLFSQSEEITNKNSQKNHINKFDTLAKISAVKFYTRFIKQSKINIFILGSGEDYLYWEFFFKSLELLDTKQKTAILSKISIFYSTNSQKSLDTFAQQIQTLSALSKLESNSRLNLEVVDISNFKSKIEFDYIYSSFNLSYQPADILIQSGRDIYNLIGRLVYTDNKDPELVVKKVAELQSPFTSKTEITSQDLKALDFEISAEIYTNKKIVDLIEKNLGFLEGTYIRFSSVILNFLIHSVRSLTKNGYIEIWDINETQESIHFQSIYRNNNERVSLPVNYDLYANILKSFKDIKVDTNVRTLQKVLSDELLDGGKEFIPLDIFINYLLDTPTAWRKVFTVENFIHKKLLKEVVSKFEISQKLYKNKVLLFGLPTLLYKTAFKGFKNKILSHSILNKYIDKGVLVIPSANNLQNEYLVAMVPNITKNVGEQKYTLISNELDSSLNKDFYEYLERIGFDKLKVMNVIDELWPDLLRYMGQKINLSLLEIQKK